MCKKICTHSWIAVLSEKRWEGAYLWRGGASTGSATFCFTLKSGKKLRFSLKFAVVLWVFFILLSILFYVWIFHNEIQKKSKFSFKYNINCRLLEIFHKEKKGGRDLREHQSFSKLSDKLKHTRHVSKVIHWLIYGWGTVYSTVNTENYLLRTKKDYLEGTWH
jgi:hypothetical protein